MPRLNRCTDWYSCSLTLTYYLCLDLLLDPDLLEPSLALAERAGTLFSKLSSPTCSQGHQVLILIAAQSCMMDTVQAILC
jgi:hypothetical protein